MQQIFNHIDTNMQDIYRKAVDADKHITELKKQGMAKYSSIIDDQQLFVTKSTLFMPYVSELAQDIEHYKSDPSDQIALTKIMKKMEQLFKLLAAFKQTL